MTRADPRLTGAEVLAASALTWIAGLIAISYLTGRAGLAIAPASSAVAAAAGAVAIGRLLTGQAHWRSVDVCLYVFVVITVLAYLLRLAWPTLLPLGRGPDLAHHLLLIDYLERHDQLAHGVEAAGHLGEMAQYTPGLHLLAVIVGALARTDGFHALYPVVSLSVALKVGFFLLILMRILRESRVRVPLSVGGVLLVAATSTYSIGSFTHDSFLAQVVGELFAVALWWAVLVWDRESSRSAVAIFAIAGIATVLTWPVWIGPPVLTLLVSLLMRSDRTVRLRLAHGALALVPPTVVAAIHAIGRSSWVSIVGTSGAVQRPTLGMLGWWLLVLALVGLTVAARDRRHRTLIVFTAAILAQTVALLLVATASGATTPYMAIKMTYLVVYPGIVAAIIALDAALQAVVSWAGDAVAPRARVEWMAAWAMVAALAVLAGRTMMLVAKPSPVVSEQLWAAGRWARDNVPPHCVDYLVGNEGTAYWLHLAVLGNSRATSRSADDNTFLTQPSFARWIVSGGVPYAIANLNILPDEIRRDVEVLQQFGSIGVIARRVGGVCP